MHKTEHSVKVEYLSKKEIITHHVHDPEQLRAHMVNMDFHKDHMVPGWQPKMAHMLDRVPKLDDWLPKMVRKRLVHVPMDCPMDFPMDFPMDCPMVRPMDWPKHR